MVIHDFELLYSPFGEEPPDFDDPVYDRLKADPPQGCEVTRRKHVLWLVCSRPGATRLEAIADTVAEVHSRTGLWMGDMGFTKLWVWPGSEESATELVAQLLMMAYERASILGIDADEVARFVSTLGQVRGS